MYWADEIAKEIIDSKEYKPYWVDDMKTLSGFAHVGSIRGPLIHDLIYRILTEQGKKAVYTFVFNDFDAVDSLSPQLKKSFSKYMGVPLRSVPSPKPGFSSFADYFNHDFRKVFEILGIHPKFLSSWDMYNEGKFDRVIKLALDNSETIQDIYKRISGSKKKELGWLPFQVVCEKCGKLSTTRVFAWDGKEVSYKCERHMVSWAQGCGYEGRISPFGGTGKLPWKVDWPAHWEVIGVTIEGAGKDLASKGGAYDIAFEIAEKVFKYPKPYKLSYEHFLIGGRKMSSSKGIGLKAHDITEILPPEVARFLFTRIDYSQAIEFNPQGTMAIPDLFDEYDRCWKAYVSESDENLGRAFELAQIKKLSKESLYLPRFRDVANYIQLPNVNLEKKFEEEKGSKLDKIELLILKEREKYAKIWLTNYAPEEYKFQITLGATAKTDLKRDFLKKLISLVKESRSAKDLEEKLYELIKNSGGSSKKMFSNLYLLLIGKDHGPKLAWLIWENKEKVLERLKEVVR